jgi:dihydrofolate reductase
MRVIAIAAAADNGVIGNSQALPWEIPEDMQFFRDSTRHHIVLMGRKTFDALGSPLPKRENAVITRDPNWKKDGVKVFKNIEDGITYYKNDSTFKDQILFVIGGGEIYTLSLPYLDEIWLTQIQGEFSGDAFFPNYRNGHLDLPGFSLQKRVSAQKVHPEHSYSFNYYSRTV